MADKRTEQAARAAGMISLMYLLSRILGFIRENLSGRLFDRFQTDSFIAAFIIPDTMYYLLVGGALSAAFIPIFTEYLSRDQEEEGWKVASTFINITVLLLASFTVFGIFYSHLFAPIEAPDFPPDKLRLLIILTKIMFPAVCFTAMAGLITGVLNSYKHFFAPVLGPVFYNIAIIICGIWLGPKFGIQGMAIGVVIGAAGNFAIQIIFMRKFSKGLYKFGYIDLKNSGFRRMLVLMLPALIGLSATQANLWITNVMASSLPEGSITALRFANRLIQLPIGIFAAGIATAFFPLLSSLAAKNEMESFKDTLALSLRSIYFLMIPAAIGLMVLNQPIVKILFEGQKFTPADTRLTAYALVFYSLALFAHAAILMIPRAYYALKDTRTPVFTSITAVVLSVLMNWFFLRYTKLGVGGFALSFSLMGIIDQSLLSIILHHKIGGIPNRGLLRSFVKTLTAAFTMGIVIFGVESLVRRWSQHSHWSGHLEAGMIVLTGMGIGALVFLVVAWLLKMDELNTIIRFVQRKITARKAV